MSLNDFANAVRCPSSNLRVKKGSANAIQAEGKLLNTLYQWDIACLSPAQPLGKWFAWIISESSVHLSRIVSKE